MYILMSACHLLQKQNKQQQQQKTQFCLLFAWYPIPKFYLYCIDRGWPACPLTCPRCASIEKLIPKRSTCTCRTENLLRTVLLAPRLPGRFPASYLTSSQSYQQQTSSASAARALQLFSVSAAAVDCGVSAASFFLCGPWSKRMMDSVRFILLKRWGLCCDWKTLIWKLR